MKKLGIQEFSRLVWEERQTLRPDPRWVAFLDDLHGKDEQPLRPAGKLPEGARSAAFEAWRGDFPKRDKQEVGPVVWVIAGLAAQLLLLKVAGFSIATGLLFAFTARAFGKKKLWYSVPVGIAISFVVWFIFARLLQLSLPAGPIEQLFI